jgi:zinc transport system substrate-binding protein
MKLKATYHRLLMLGLGLFALNCHGELLVVASIKPLALIAQEVVGDKAKVETLLPVTASPHDYPLKVSDHMRLHRADVVLWVGPELESFLARPLSNLTAKQVMSAYKVAGIHWPEESSLEHENHGEHALIGGDPHLWLDPRNASLVAEALAQRLAAIAPASAEIFRRNAAQFTRKNKQLDAQLSADLAVVASRGFGVAHEGYGHFVSRYQLRQLAYVTLTPERRPGAKHLQSIRSLLTDNGHCLFVEPFAETNQSLTRLAQDLNLSIAVLDPIGAQVQSYQQLMQGLAASFLTCLTQGKGQ